MAFEWINDNEDHKKITTACHCLTILAENLNWQSENILSGDDDDGGGHGEKILFWRKIYFTWTWNFLSWIFFNTFGKKYSKELSWSLRISLPSSPFEKIFTNVSSFCLPTRYQGEGSSRYLRREMTKVERFCLSAKSLFLYLSSWNLNLKFTESVPSRQSQVGGGGSHSHSVWQHFVCADLLWMIAKAVFFKNGPITASFSVYFRLFNMSQFKFIKA